MMSRILEPVKGPIFMSSRMSGVFEKSPFSGTEKHPDFQVTSCHHFDTTNANFAYIESEYMSIFCENSDIF